MNNTRAWFYQIWSLSIVIVAIQIGLESLDFWRCLPPRPDGRLGRRWAPPAPLPPVERWWIPHEGMWAPLTTAGGRQGRSRQQERPRRGWSTRVDMGDSAPSWGVWGFLDAGATVRIVRPHFSPIAGHVRRHLRPLCRGVGAHGRREGRFNGLSGVSSSTPLPRRRHLARQCAMKT